MAGKKHGSCVRHDKLPCGCKVCVTPTSTAYLEPLTLIAFHANIHAVQRARAARPRLAGDGKDHSQDVRHWANGRYWDHIPTRDEREAVAVAA